MHAVLDLERLATLGTLAGGIGHELSNVVSVLVSAAEGIEFSAKNGQAPEAEDLTHMRRALDHVRAHVRAGLRTTSASLSVIAIKQSICSEVVAESRSQCSSGLGERWEHVCP